MHLNGAKITRKDTVAQYDVSIAITGTVVVTGWSTVWIICLTFARGRY